MCVTAIESVIATVKGIQFGFFSQAFDSDLGIRINRARNERFEVLRHLSLMLIKPGLIRYRVSPFWSSRPQPTLLLTDLGSGDSVEQLWSPLHGSRPHQCFD